MSYNKNNIGLFRPDAFGQMVRVPQMESTFIRPQDHSFMLSPEDREAFRQKLTPFAGPPGPAMVADASGDDEDVHVVD